MATDGVYIRCSRCDADFAGDRAAAAAHEHRPLLITLRWASGRVGNEWSEYDPPRPARVREESYD